MALLETNFFCFGFLLHIIIAIYYYYLLLWIMILLPIEKGLSGT